MKTLLSKVVDLKAPLFAVVLLSLVVGCKKSTTDPVSPAGVEGSYKITAIKIDPKVSGFDDLLPLYNLSLGTTCLSDVTITFKTGGTITTDNPASCQSSSSKISDATGFDSSSKWSLSGSKLTITNTGSSPDVYDVTNDGTTLSLKTQSDEDFTNSGTKTKYTITLQLHRQ